MKIFVFGAGASRAAQDQTTYTDSHEEAAPLVNDLFNEQYINAKKEGINFDAEDCRKKVKEAGSLEKWLTEKWKNIMLLKTPRAQEAEKTWFGNVNLYLWILLNSISKTYPDAQGYSNLLKKLFEENFGIISFNYDTLLDKSYMDVFNNPLSSKEYYLNANFVKLHGSVNWFLRAREHAADGDLPPQRHKGDIGVRLRGIASHMYNGNPMSMNQLEILEPKHSSLSSIASIMNYFENRGYFYPLLFMPLTNKAYSTVSDFKDVMIAKAQEMLSCATDIYFIGYSANDDLMHAILKKAPSHAKLHVIGINETSVEEIANRTLSMNNNLTRGKISAAGIDDFVKSY